VTIDDFLGPGFRHNAVVRSQLLSTLGSLVAAGNDFTEARRRAFALYRPILEALAAQQATQRDVAYRPDWTERLVSTVSQTEAVARAVAPRVHQSLVSPLTGPVAALLQRELLTSQFAFVQGMTLAALSSDEALSEEHLRMVIRLNAAIRVPPVSQIFYAGVLWGMGETLVSQHEATGLAIAYATTPGMIFLSAEILQLVSDLFDLIRADALSDRAELAGFTWVSDERRRIIDIYSDRSLPRIPEATVQALPAVLQVTANRVSRLGVQAFHLGKYIAPLVFDIIVEILGPAAGEGAAMRAARTSQSRIAWLDDLPPPRLKRAVKPFVEYVAERAARLRQRAQQVMDDVGRRLGFRGERVRSEPPVPRQTAPALVPVRRMDVPVSRLAARARMARVATRLREAGRISVEEAQALRGLPEEHIRKLETRARSNLNAYLRGGRSRTGAVNGVKGNVLERFIETLPEHQQTFLYAQTVARSRGFPDVRFTMNVTDVVNESTGELSDGLIYGIQQRHDGRPRVLILAVYEAKSRNFRLLAREPGSIHGQMQRTLARLETGSVTIDGQRLSQNEIELLSDYQRRTRWVGVVPRALLTPKQFENLTLDMRGQGRRFIVVEGPVSVEAMEAIADALLQDLSLHP